MSAWGWSILVSALVDFVLGGGAVLTGFMVAKGTVMMPSGAAWVFAGVTGLMAAAKDVQSKMSAPKP